jgi:hypothetical protein
VCFFCRVGGKAITPMILSRTMGLDIPARAPDAVERVGCRALHGLKGQKRERQQAKC